MGTTSTSRFLAVGSRELNLNTGWTIKVRDYKDMTSLISMVGEYTSFSFTQELNGPGQGSITIDEDSPFWTRNLSNGQPHRAILDNEYVFEAWENNVARFAWLGQTITRSFATDDETRSVTISGPGIAQVLSWAIINRPGWPRKVPIISYTPSQADPHKKIPNYRTNSSTDSLSAFLWRFPVKWPTMRMWYTVFRAAQRRGVIKFVTPMFSALKDSGNQPWLWVKTIDEIATKEGYQPQEPAENLLDFLNDCTGQDYSKWFGQRLEWIMHPGFKLDVRRTIGTDRSKTIRFFAGNILNDERTQDREAIFNRVIAVDVDGNESIRTDKRSVSSWNLREQRNETNKNVTDTALRNQLADRYIKQTKDEKEQWSVTIPYTDPGRIPYRNFFVGDYVGLNESPFGAPTPAIKFRVMAITVSLSADQTIPDCELTLKSLLDAKMDELTKQITQLINNPRNVNLNDIKEISIPEKPKVKSGLVYDPDTGKWVAAPVSDLFSGTGGNRVFFSTTDPANVASNNVTAGDFWFDTGS